MIPLNNRLKLTMKCVRLKVTRRSITLLLFTWMNMLRSVLPQISSCQSNVVLISLLQTRQCTDPETSSSLMFTSSTPSIRLLNKETTSNGWATHLLSLMDRNLMCTLQEKAIIQMALLPSLGKSPQSKLEASIMLRFPLGRFQHRGRLSESELMKERH